MNLEELYKKIEIYFKQQQELNADIYLDKEIIALDFVLHEIENHTKKRLEEIKEGKELEQMKLDNIDDNFFLFDEEPEWKASTSLSELHNKIHRCTECPLGFSRQNFVFGAGNPNADIMIIGEAPGADEDELGEPFVGKAGQLLTKILKAIDLEREDVYIANIIKCRPPKNRVPTLFEVTKCEPYLKKQIELINPEYILALGLTAVETLLKKKFKMAEIRGKLFNYENKKMIVTYHPAALLRNPIHKKEVWEDVQLLRKMYDEFLSNK